ncbi:MAG: response regulator transcription factor [Dehalococcoidia bacterium]|nr:response regulator transcription factor [Dehalococcoidia bacterium]
MVKDIRILIVDDHQVVRDGLWHMLGQEEDMELVGHGASDEEALSHVEMFSPNMVLMDIKMPTVNGIELTRQLKQKYPSCKVIMLTLYDEYVAQAIEAGAGGYLLKDIKREELTQAIRWVHQGEVVISKNIASKSRINYERKGAEKPEGGLPKEHHGSNDGSKEIALVVLPSADDAQLLRFICQLEEKLKNSHASIAQIVGSWEQGTVITLKLSDSSSESILEELQRLPDVEKEEEEPAALAAFPGHLKSLGAMLGAGMCNKRIRITLRKLGVVRQEAQIVLN